jgi:type II secretory pathway predicted ATPase ExeA
MFKEFYGLQGDPFRLSPDHNFCYRYPSFAKGRAYMQYALQAAEGFVVITGSPGMGKTTLINDLLSDYGQREHTVATLVNTMLEANEVLRCAAYEFDLNVEHMDTATVLQRLKQLFTQAHRDGRPPLLIVDEAQNLTLNALEELRMLTNLQLDGKPLLQIFLVGQDGLRKKLQEPDLEQLRQRVTAAAHLYPLDQDQVAAYIIHRLKVVGWKGYPKLMSSLLPVIEAACEGVPRRINQFCSRLLLHGAVEQKSVLNGEDAKLVFAELSEERLSRVPMNMSDGMDTELLDTNDRPSAGSARPDYELRSQPQEPEARKKVVVTRPEATKIPELPPVAQPAVTPPLHPHHHRPPHRIWLGVAVLLLFAAGSAVYSWYQMDRETAEDLMGFEIDSFLNAQRNESSENTEDVVSLQIEPIERLNAPKQNTNEQSVLDATSANRY